jgi:esterase/lipase
VRGCAPVFLALLIGGSLPGGGCSTAVSYGSGAADHVERGSSDVSASNSFPAPDGNFARYREQVRKFVMPRSMSHRNSAAVELNLPFERQANPSVPYRGRFLLFHGLNDSPYVWHDIADELAVRGFDARAVLFEGHGTTPRDMLDVSYTSWLTTARQHLAIGLQDEVPIYIGGFSMGAVIATLLALEQPGDIAGLLLISPAYHSQLNNYLRWSGLYSRFRPWVFGGMIHEDNPIKYNSIPVNSGAQFFNVTQKLKRRWGNQLIDIPTLMIATEDDSVIDIDVVRNVFRQCFINDQRLLLIYRAEPVAPVRDKEETRTSEFLDKRILNQSHLGLMYAPDNVLFGERGSVLVCNGNEYPVYMACMRASGHWFGAQHTLSPDGTPVARTTYSPDFDAMMQRFDVIFPVAGEIANPSNQGVPLREQES